MYGEVASACAPVACAVAVTQLPNTGSNIWVVVAVAVGAGLLTWALLNKKKQTQEQ